MKSFKIGGILVTDLGEYVSFMSRDQTYKDREQWTSNTLTKEEAKRFLENLKEMIG